MAVASNNDAFIRALKFESEAMVDDMLGRGYVEGLSFKVRLDSRHWSRFYKRPICDHPFTKAEHRRHVWHQRKRRAVRPFKTAKYRGFLAAKLAWDALHGREPERDW